MKSTESPEHQSAIRTEAWVQAWIDTWGKDPRIQLIDLGGRKRPLEQVYITKYWLKKILPINTLCLAGTGFGAISTPRAEYNDIGSLIAMAGGKRELIKALTLLNWQQFAIPDIDTTTTAIIELQELVENSSWRIQTEKKELAYSIFSRSFEEYLERLGSSTRRTYFNRRERLACEGEISFIDFELREASVFFRHLNQFHIPRWGVPCYAKESQDFIRNFAERLTAAGGELIMQGLNVNGELVSVLLDVIWGNTRYNLQSGFIENRFKKIALGSLHLGYAIQTALERGQRYDFLAGEGKHGNYKGRIATHTKPLESVWITASKIADLKFILQRLRNG